MANNANSVVAPEWLNDNFIRDLIRKFDHDDTIVLTEAIVLRSGVAPGEHYGSEMFRTTVHYRSVKADQPKSLPLIIKTKPVVAGDKKELLEHAGIFAREIQMYSETLPKMARLLKEIGETFIYPAYIHGALEPHVILVLEDVSDKGWKPFGFVETYEEAMPVVSAIAKFHAASIMLEKEDAHFRAKFVTVPDMIITAFQPLIDKAFQELLDFAKSSAEFEHFTEPLQRLKGPLKERYALASSPSDSYVNVLMHGDFHGKNLLHQFNADNRIQDTMLIDYQVCGWTSPVVDVYYLLDMIVSHPVKENHRHELVYRYHTQFCNYLQRLGYLGKIPTLTDLQVELLKAAVIEIFHYLIFYPARYMDPSDANFAAYIAGKVPNPALSNPEFLRILKTELTRFLHQGAI